MTSTGYKEMVFTEINPTSTTTTIVVNYNRGYVGAYVFTIGPFALIQHDVGAPTPTNPNPTLGTAPENSATPAPPATVTVVEKSSVTSINPPICESLVATFLLIFWLLPFSVGVDVTSIFLFCR